jgi:hypothetical protein
MVLFKIFARWKSCETLRLLYDAFHLRSDMTFPHVGQLSE